MPGSRGTRDLRVVPGWRIALTLLGVLGGVALLTVGAFVAVDRLTPRSAPPSREPGVASRTFEPTRSTEVSPPTPAPTPTGTAEPTPTTPAPAPAPQRAAGVVVIDAGHQARSNPDPEPIGPGSKQTKPGVSSGTRGVATGKPESELALEVSLKLRDELQRRGVRVVMVRTSQNVDLTNRERAAVANRAKADLFVRIHADGSTDRDRRGVQTLVPASNQWTRPIVRRSVRAGRLVQAATLRATLATDLGVTPRSDITGFNWSQVPTVLVEVGFMSNPVEDRLLATDAYQRKLARGITDGVVSYLRGRR